MTKGIQGLEEVLELRDAFVSVQKTLNKGGGNFYFDKVERYVKVLFEKFAPFKPGDRVRITVDPQINMVDSWGFMKGKHFLVVGALGTVDAVDVSEDGAFRAGVIWDDDSRISSDGIITKIAPENRKQWWFSEDKIARADTPRYCSDCGSALFKARYGDSSGHTTEREWCPRDHSK